MVKSARVENVFQIQKHPVQQDIIIMELNVWQERPLPRRVGPVVLKSPAHMEKNVQVRNVFPIRMPTVDQENTTMENSAWMVPPLHVLLERSMSLENA
jgi:hypothetical protein